MENKTYSIEDTMTKKIEPLNIQLINPDKSRLAGLLPVQSMDIFDTEGWIHRHENRGSTSKNISRTYSFKESIRWDYVWQELRYLESEREGFRKERYFGRKDWIFLFHGTFL